MLGQSVGGLYRRYPRDDAGGCFTGRIIVISCLMVCRNSGGLLSRYGDVTTEGKTDEQIAEEGLAALENWMNELGLVMKISQLGCYRRDDRRHR